MSAEPRSYVVGLPVIITITADGEVLYEIDSAEAGSEVVNVWHEHRLARDGGDEPTMLQDVDLIEADHERRMGR